MQFWTGKSKKKKVILIRAGINFGRIPHALLSLAANLDDEVLILDDATPELIALHREVIERAICVGISTMTGPQVKYSLEVARAIRSINPNTPIIWGGYHPSLKPEQTLENAYVDKVIVGQGEQAFRDMVENIKSGNKVENIVAYKYQTKKNFPVYDFDLLDMSKYVIPYISSRSISLYTSQGCPCGCKFCSVSSIYGNRYSGWDIERVVGLIAGSVRRYCISGVHFDDDNFFIGKEKALEFARLLLKRNININWSADARVDTLCHLQADEWDILDRSGCTRLLVGAESGSVVTLKKLNKKITPEMTLKFGNLCYKFNIAPCFSMMVGVPGESMEEINETFSFIDRVKKEIPTSELLLFIYTPYPGTKLYETSLAKGYVEPDSLEGWGNHYLNCVTTPWVDKSLLKRVDAYNLPVQRDITKKRVDSLKFKSQVFFYRALLALRDPKRIISKIKRIYPGSGKEEL